MKLTQLLTEEIAGPERIVTGDIRPIVNQRFIDQGYKQYKTKKGKLIPLESIKRTQYDYSKDYEDNTVYFLNDKEIEYAKRVESNILQIIEQQDKQRKLMLQYLPAFIREILTKEISSQNQGAPNTNEG